jgi:8-oxo-dGTP pyrophosphatase MutT (NUDIX family)
MGSNLPVIAHPAATVILLRPSIKATNGFEVLLLLRSKAVKFAGGSWVFPGGRVDQADYRDNHEDTYSAIKVAAVREVKEEAGLDLNPAHLDFFSHWTTPLAEKKRFATWFLIAPLLENKEIEVDDSEIVDFCWLTPQAAIDLHNNQTLKILPPTYLTLTELAQSNSIEAAIIASKKRETPHYFPSMVFHDQTASILLNDDAGHSEGNIDASYPHHRMTLKDSVWHYIKT